jgi:hypothetical protein
MPGVRDNQREGHPGAAPFGSVRTGRAFRQGFLPWRKGIGIHANAPLRGLIVQSSPSHRGPMRAERALFEKPRAKRKELKSKELKSREQIKSAVCCTPSRRLAPAPSARMDARCSSGAPWALGCPFLGLLFFGQAKKSDSGPRWTETSPMTNNLATKHKQQHQLT